TAATVNGWNNTSVAVRSGATDALSGIDGTPTFDSTLASEGASQSVSHTFLDRAGNPGSATVADINIDLTPPALTFAAPTPAANSAGWNNTDVAIAFGATDALSGLDGTSPLSPLVLAREGDAISATVSATDRAGNSASARS